MMFSRTNISVCCPLRERMAARNLSFFCLLLLMVPTAFSVFSNIPGLDRFCSLRMGHIHCDIHVVNFLDFKDIRKLLSAISDNSGVILNITCGYTGQLQLPWPMKSWNIKELWVDGCHINGFYSRTGKTMSEISDKMVQLKIENSILETSVFDALKLFSQDFKKGFECGQLTLNSLIMRNISYQFVLESKDATSFTADDMLVDTGDVSLSNDSPKHACDYKDLEVIDISKSPDGMTYFIMPFDYSKYPKLTVYNMSSSGIISFPDIFTTWENLFPNLENLDLSGNEIDSFDLITNDTLEMNRVRPLFINFRSNQFQNVPQAIKHILDTPTPVIVDLSDNPLKCGCDTLIYKDHIDKALKRYPEFESLKDSTCLQSTGKTINIIDFHGANC